MKGWLGWAWSGKEVKTHKSGVSYKKFKTAWELISCSNKFSTTFLLLEWLVCKQMRRLCGCVWFLLLKWQLFPEENTKPALLPTIQLGYPRLRLHALFPSGGEGAGSPISTLESNRIWKGKREERTSIFSSLLLWFLFFLWILPSCGQAQQHQRSRDRPFCLHMDNTGYKHVISLGSNTRHLVHTDNWKNYYCDPFGDFINFINIEAETIPNNTPFFEVYYDIIICSPLANRIWSFIILLCISITL